MTTRSKYPAFRSKLDQLCYEIFSKVIDYSRKDSETKAISSKILFFGVNSYQNGVPHFINWDIIYLYKSLQKRGIEARIHDPHISGPQGISVGLWLGRHHKDDNWGHSFDCIILSCPHLFYIQNMSKLSNLFIPDKQGLLLDLWGAFTKIYRLGDSIDIVSFRHRCEVAGMMGGMDMMNNLKRLN